MTQYQGLNDVSIKNVFFDTKNTVDDSYKASETNNLDNESKDTNVFEKKSGIGFMNFYIHPAT